MTTLVRGARQLLTLRGPAGPRRGPALRELGLVPNGSVLVRGGVIVAAGPSRTVDRLADLRRARVIEAAGKVVMPGFVDCHTHLVCGPPRLEDYERRIAGAGYREIAAAGGGILFTVRAVRRLSARALEEQARRTLAAMARHGTTTVEAKSGYGLDRTAEIKTLRVAGRFPQVIPTYLGAHIPPPEMDADRYIAWMADCMLPLVARRKLARFADVYCDAGAFTVEQARRYLRRAAEVGLRLKIHAEQFARTGAALLAVELGAATADHLEQAGEEEVAALARSETIAVLLPGSVFHLGLSRYAPARALIDAGAAVALATDHNPGTSPTFSMPMVLSLACTQMRMTPAEAVAAATINAAHAVGAASRAGSLEPGKQADLIVLDLADYRELPYYFGTNNVATTLIAGEVIA